MKKIFVIGMLSAMISLPAWGYEIAERSSYSVRSGTGIWETQFHPVDESLILVASGRNFAQITYDPIEPIWSLDIDNPYAFMGVQYSADGSLAAAGGYDAITVYDTQTASQLVRIPFTEALDFFDALSFSQDSTLMFAGDPGGEGIVAYDTESWTVVRRFDCPESCAISAIRQSEDGRKIHASTPQKLYSWDFTDGRLLNTITTRYSLEVKEFAFTPSCEFVFVADGRRNVSHFDVETGAVEQTFEHPAPTEIASFAVDPTQSYLVTYGTLGRAVDRVDFMTVWDILTGEVHQRIVVNNPATFEDPARLPRSISFSADGRRLQWSNSNNIYVHDVTVD